MVSPTQSVLNNGCTSMYVHTDWDIQINKDIYVLGTLLSTVL